MSALASQCAQHCFDERNFADSGEICYAIVILGLVLAQILAQERQDNRPQHLIYVRLDDQVSLYKHHICRPRVLTSTEGHCKNPCLIRILEFCDKWREDKSALTLIFLAAIGATNPNKASN